LVTNKKLTTDDSSSASSNYGGSTDESTSDKKEKSVLQSKLTKLALNIGYFGKVFVDPACIY
jgi:hypothetical protein